MKRARDLVDLEDEDEPPRKRRRRLFPYCRHHVVLQYLDMRESYRELELMHKEAVDELSLRFPSSWHLDDAMGPI